MSVPAIEPGGFVPLVAPSVTPTETARSTAPVAAGQAADFGAMLSTGLQRLEGVQDRADALAVQAATGDLSQIHDYTIAATEASVSTQLTAAVRNKALEAFQEIMRISI